MNIFISHIHEDLEIAKAIRTELEKCFGEQVKLFLAEDIPLGSNWFENIRKSLAEADLILALFSPRSMERPWINIEAGYGIMADKDVVPICCLGLQKSDLPIAYVLQQAMHIDELIDFDKLLERISKSTSAGRFLGDKAKTCESWQSSIAAACSESIAISANLNQRAIKINVKSEVYFHIVNKLTGGCLDVEGWGKTDGIGIIQYPYHGGDNQLWQIKQVEHSYYRIISKHSGKCLEVKDGSAADGAVIAQKEYENSANQQWDFTKLQDGAYKISVKHSGKCLSVQESELFSRSQVIQTSWHDLPGQRWWLKVNVTPI